MAPLLTILRSLGRASRRELGTFSSLKVNNFFLFIALLVGAAVQSGVEPKSAEFLILLLALFLLFPLSSDPLALIPPSRLDSWPLDARQRLLLRLSSVLLSPVIWIAFAIFLLTARSRLALLWFAMTAAVQAVKLVGRPAAGVPARRIPQMGGPLGGLIRIDLREMLSVLDPYLALVISAGGAAYRILATDPDPQAAVVLSLLVGIALSTYAQCLFGLDVTGSALTRYRLLPLHGWQILLAKDAAWFTVLLVLLAPLNLLTGATFGLVALAVGHHPSVMLRSSIYRWRFAGSRLFPGVVQGIVAIVIGFAAAQHGWPYTAGAAALYLVSLALYGRLLDGQLRGA